MAVYGRIHQIADFVARSLSKEKAPFAHEIIDFLKAMSAVQENNALVTMAVQTGDGLRIVYEGSFLSLVIPQQKHVRVIAKSTTKDGRNLRVYLDALARDEKAQHVDTGDYDYWRVLPGNLTALSVYFNELKGFLKADGDTVGRHPRTFSGAVREAALTEFERSGLVCPGVNRKPHKLDLSTERIAFDHILPFARGGASSEFNVQVLCEACNLQKRATALGNAAQ